MENRYLKSQVPERQIKLRRCRTIFMSQLLRDTWNTAEVK